MILETQKLSKIYGKTKAVNDLNLSIPEGAIYGFLGPNGAGKTTTLKMLTGLIKPNSGNIIIDGKELHFSSNASGTGIGYLPDVPNFYDWMTAPAFLTFAGELMGLRGSALKKAVDDLLDMTGLGGVTKKVRSFSRGMKQRLGIAQALINEPKLVLLDEPTSALDPIGRKDVIDIMAQLKGRTTVIFSTHIINDIERVCSHVGVINKGRLIAEDEIHNLESRHSANRIKIETTSESADLLAKSIDAKLLGCQAEQIPDGVIFTAKNLNEIYSDLLSAISTIGIIPRKIEIIRPNLEDVFLKLVKNDDK